MPNDTDPPLHPPVSEHTRHRPRIKVISAGGAGNNAINRMIDLGLEGVEFISVNTDLQALRSSKAPVRLQVGARLTQGLGTGANPAMAKRAATDESDKIVEALEGSDMVFITAGLGGGTGTGVAPVIASAASRMGALTVAVVTLPFAFEGKRRMTEAERGLEDLLDHVDTLIVVRNDRLLFSAKDMGFFESFQIADDVLRQAVQGISDLVAIPGVINRDFADVRTTMAGMGYGVMGTASRSGPHRAREAAIAAISSPLLVAGAIEGARGILINIAGSNTLSLSEVHEASSIVQHAAHEDANIIFGAVLDERLGEEVKITVIATGYDEESRDRAERRTLQRSRIEMAAVALTMRHLPPLDEAVRPDGPTPLHSEWKPPELPTPDIAANTVREAAHSSVTPQGPAFRSREDRTAALNFPKSSRIKESYPSEADSTHKPIDLSPPHAGAVPTEEYLLASIDGPPFDLESAGNDDASAAGTETLIQPELANLRRAAIAAYASLATRPLEVQQSVSPEAASFAEILENRRQIHGADEHESDRLLDEEVAPHQEMAASNSALADIARWEKVDSHSPYDTSRSHKPIDDAMPEPPSDSDLTVSRFLDGAASPYPVAAMVSTHNLNPQSLQTKGSTPDFNRKLNREPDFSMGVDVI